MAKRKRSKWQTMIYKTLHRKPKTEQHHKYPWGELRYSGRVSRSCYINDTPRVTLVKIPVVCHQWLRSCILNDILCVLLLNSFTKKGVLDSQPQVIKFTNCLPMVGGSLRVLQFSTTKTGRHDIAEILLKVALNTINQIKSNLNSQHPSRNPVIYLLCINEVTVMVLLS